MRTAQAILVTLACVGSAIGQPVLTLLSGPDWTDLPELKPSEIDFDPFIGACDLHSYFARFDWTPSQGYSLAQAEPRVSARRIWARERGKALFLRERGTMVFGWNASNPGPNTFDEAKQDAELVVRALNACIAGSDVIPPAIHKSLHGQAQTPRSSVQVVPSELDDDAAFVAGEWL